MTLAAARSGASTCGTSIDAASGPDDVCYDLARTLAERVGLVAAAITAVLVLTMVGLSRLAARTDPERGTLPP